MVIRYFDLIRIRFPPSKADAPLIIDADTMLPGPFAGEFLQPVSRWYAQIAQAFSRIQDGQFSPGYLQHGRRKFPYSLPREDAFRIFIAKRFDHPCHNNAMRY